VQEAGRLSGLRARLKAKARKCPYCGFGEVSELDHHLPRSVYRALAIYASNLIPCCHVCNNRKRALAAESPEEQFAHVYLENLPDERFMTAQVAVSPNGLQVEFSIQMCPGMTTELLGRLRYQFDRFGLNSRYQAEVNVLLGSLRVAIEDTGNAGPGALRSFLERSRNSLQAEFGINDWRSALVHALAESDAFCNGGFRYCFGQP
jgi:hypothetical protein